MLRIEIIIFLFCSLIAFGVIFAQDKQEEQPEKGGKHEQLDEKLKLSADEMLRKMASEKYREREEAGMKLAKLLEESGENKKALYEYLKKQFEETEDEDTKRALKRILAYCYIPGPPLFRIYVNKKCGFIDKTGKVVIEPKFYDARDFSEGFAVVKSGTSSFPKWGLIDKTGKLVVPYDYYRRIEDFSEGFAAVYQTTKTTMGLPMEMKAGFIDRTFSMVIKPQFDKVYPFSDGLAKVKLGKKWGYIDKTGKFVWKHP